MTVKAGLTFIHRSYLDPGFRPGPGQTYAGGPKARMVVTHVAAGRVWYGYADRVPAKGMWVMDRDVFEQRYVLPSLEQDPPDDGSDQATGSALPKGTLLVARDVAIAGTPVPPPREDPPC